MKEKIMMDYSNRIPMISSPPSIAAPSKIYKKDNTSQITFILGIEGEF